MLLTAVAFFVAFSLIVLVHEWGHFVMARRAGIKVLEFGFGLPPRLKTLAVRDGVEYTLNAIPVGAFVRLLGENDSSAPGSFASKSAGARISALLAGPGMNLLLAVVLVVGLLMFVGEAIPSGQVVVQDVTANSPAEQAGIRPGDVILALEGQEVTGMTDLMERVRMVTGQEVSITLLRGDQQLTARLTPRAQPPAGEGAMGVTIRSGYRIVRHPIWEAIPLAAYHVGQAILLTFAAFVRIFRLGISQGELAGPIGFVQLSGEAARLGVAGFLEFIAIVSVNIAVFNLLPLPVLDGGRVLLVLVEKLRGGKRIAPHYVGLVQLMSIMLLLALILVLSYFDVLRIVGGTPILR